MLKVWSIGVRATNYETAERESKLPIRQSGGTDQEDEATSRLVVEHDVEGGRDTRRRRALDHYADDTEDL